MAIIAFSWTMLLQSNINLWPFGHCTTQYDFTLAQHVQKVCTLRGIGSFEACAKVCCLLELSRLSEIQQRAPLIQLATQPIGATCCGVGVFHCFTTHKGYFYDRLFAIFREKWLIVCISYAQRSRGGTHGPPTRPSISWTFIAVTSKPSNWSCSAAKRWANVGRQPLRHHHHLAMCHVAIKTHIRKSSNSFIIIILQNMGLFVGYPQLIPMAYHHVLHWPWKTGINHDKSGLSMYYINHINPHAIPLRHRASTFRITQATPHGRLWKVHLSWSPGMGLHKRLKLSSYVIVTLISTLKQHVVYICLYNYIYNFIYIIIYIIVYI